MENFSQSNPIRYPDYHNCIASLACSLLQYYGINPPNSTLPQADALLQKKYKNIVLLLLDGMGMNILKKHLSKDSFFCRKDRVFLYLSTHNRSGYRRRRQRSVSQPVRLAWMDRLF